MDTSQLVHATILLTGATGYIGARLLIVLAESGHDIIVLVRSKARVSIPAHLVSKITLIEGDLADKASIDVQAFVNIDAAYYLVHSMAYKSKGFAENEARCARNFVSMMEQTHVKQLIYLSGLGVENATSEHMQSRYQVEKILRQSSIPTVILRAGIIIGSGSISFEIIRDLVEKLPIMVAPKWVFSKCQPIAIADVLVYLKEVLGNTACYNATFDIGGPNILTYYEMMLSFAKIRHLRRYIIPVPFLTPYLSSLWLFFITAANFSVARALVNSLKTDAICKDTSISQVIEHSCMSYTEAIKRTLEQLEQSAIISSWKDAISTSRLMPKLSQYMQVPSYGCLKSNHTILYNTPRDKVVDKLWQIGGHNGWYYMNWAWKIRGWIDRMVGGVGLRRGRTHPSRLQVGSSLDFWRVLTANKEQGHLLLYAEMRLPGEAWLEWTITEKEGKTEIQQTATFRPKGVLGRLYWYLLLPIHKRIFYGLCNSIGKGL